MKFSTILTSAFFALFIFTTTATFATPYDTFNNTANEEIKLGEDGHGLVTIVNGRNVEVSDTKNRLPNENDYSLTVKVMKGFQVMAQQSANQPNVSLDLNSLDAGTYLLVATTSTGDTERQIIVLD